MARLLLSFKHQDSFEWNNLLCCHMNFLLFKLINQSFWTIFSARGWFCQNLWDAQPVQGRSRPETPHPPPQRPFSWGSAGRKDGVIVSSFSICNSLIIKNLDVALRQYNLHWLRVVGLIWVLFSGLSLAPTRRSPREVKSFSLAGFPILRRSPSAKHKLPCPLKNQMPHQYF